VACRDSRANFVLSGQGFTLIEVLIAIVVFSIGLLALSALQSSAIRGNAGAYSITDTTLAASSSLESILSAGYFDNILTPGSHSVQEGNHLVTYDVNETIPNVEKKITLRISRMDKVRRNYIYNIVVTNIP